MYKIEFLILFIFPNSSPSEFLSLLVLTLLFLSYNVEILNNICLSSPKLSIASHLVLSITSCLHYLNMHNCFQITEAAGKYSELSHYFSLYLELKWFWETSTEKNPTKQNGFSGNLFISTLILTFSWSRKHTYTSHKHTHTLSLYMHGLIIQKWSQPEMFYIYVFNKYKYLLMCQALYNTRNNMSF